MRHITYIFGLTTFLLCLKLHQTAPLSPALEVGALGKKLRALSKLGEDYVEDEVKKALMGIKQMKETMEINEEKHENILKSLKKTKEEKEEAVRLFQDISEKLSEVEMQCKQLLQTQWDGCQVCLDRSCITFYTNSCSQQGLQAFIVKDHELFKEWPPSLNTESTEVKNTGEYYMTAQLSQAEDMFSKLISDVGLIFNRSTVFFTNFQKAFDESFQKLFLSDVKHPETTTTVPRKDPVIISDYFEHWEFSSLVQGLYEFGQTFFEAMSDFVITMFKKLNSDSEDLYIPMEEVPANLKTTPENPKCNKLQNATECSLFQERCQLCFETVTKDCPDVIELHLKSESALKLVNVSSHQYDDVVQLSQQYNDDMFNIVSQMKEEYGWVAEHTNTTSGTKTLFSIEKVSSSPSTKDQNVYDTVVEVKIFASPNVVIRLPANVDIDSQEFIPYVAKKALEHYKHNF
ncbi:clusterin-like protein 1 [Rana temporaria]|uniref:clusterin-like protein 1 n=1 Tax=Rana temporaria TaxID=8407 RepID=UPI001AAD48E7|nr:clusterin-like protein 1 [Rana temporaria]